MITYQINKTFNLHTIMNSGQCFRMEQGKNNIGQRYFDVYSKDKFIRVFEYPSYYSFKCEGSDLPFWNDYFDLGTDYKSFFDKIDASDDQFLKSAARYGKGMRILNQDYWEMVVSFIISQNNNIPRIKKTIADFCERFGRPFAYGTDILHAFPTRQELAGITIKDLQGLGLGYRDKYILNACTCSDDALKADKKTLLKLSGVGPKVASCILLYGAHDLDQYPVDTWVQRIMKDVYGGEFDYSPYIGFAGFVQILQFYYYRHIMGKTN